jgi:hypothetical protein
VARALEIVTTSAALPRGAALRLADAFPALRAAYLSSAGFNLEELIVGERRALLREARRLGRLPLPEKKREAAMLGVSLLLARAVNKEDFEMAQNIVDSFSFGEHGARIVAKRVHNPPRAAVWLIGHLPSADAVCDGLRKCVVSQAVDDAEELDEYVAGGTIDATAVAPFPLIRHYLSRNAAVGHGSAVVSRSRLAEIESDFRTLALLELDNGPCASGRGEADEERGGGGRVRATIRQLSSAEIADALSGLGEVLSATRGSLGSSAGQNTPR